MPPVLIAHDAPDDFRDLLTARLLLTPTTPPTMPPVLIAHDAPDDFRDLLTARLPDVEFVYATTAQGVIDALTRHDPEVVFSIKHPGFPGPAHTPIPAHPSVRWIQIGGSGFDHLLPWDAARVTVTNGAGVLAPYLAESVTGAMLALGCGFLSYVGQQRARQWNPVAFTPLRDRTLLVVGFGRIGECVACNAKALGMRVLAIRGTPAPHPAADEMHGPDALPALLPEADFVSLHVRLNAATRGLLSRERLAAIKPGAYLINTSRGPVVDEAALIDALRSGHLGGAYLDVFETEPLPADSPLWAMPNVLITPHASDNIHGWPRRFAELFANNLARWRAGEPLLNPVTP